MKKLMVASATLMMAYALSAASCIWGSAAGDWRDIDGNDLTEGNATIFFYLGTVSATDTAFDTSAATFIASSGFDFDVWGYGKLDSENLVSYDAIQSTAPNQAYSLVLVDQDVSSLDGYEGNYIILDGLSEQVSIPGATVSYYADFSNVAEVTASSWSTMPVPEPTSGLLMLLGMAGLALRRRRA